MIESQDKLNKAYLNYLKSKIYLLASDIKKAEESISKALKLNANDSIFWDMMSEILYQK